MKKINDKLCNDMINTAFDTIRKCDRLDIVNEPVESTVAPVNLNNTVFHGLLTPEHFVVEDRKIIFEGDLPVTFDKDFTVEKLYLCLSCKGVMLFTCGLNIPTGWEYFGANITIPDIELITIV